MVAVRQSPTDNLLHNRRFTFFAKLLKCIVVLFAINKFNVDRNKAFSDEKVVIDDASDAAIAIDKWVHKFKSEMEPSNSFNDVFVVCGNIISYVTNEHFMK